MLRSSAIFARRVPSVLRRARSTALAEQASPPTAPALPPGELQLLKDIEGRVSWLASLMIDNANNVRPKRDSIKVGGHQASSASVATILTALYVKVRVCAVQLPGRVEYSPRHYP